MFGKIKNKTSRWGTGNRLLLHIFYRKSSWTTIWLLKRILTRIIFCSKYFLLYFFTFIKKINKKKTGQKLHKISLFYSKSLKCAAFTHQWNLNIILQRNLKEHFLKKFNISEILFFQILDIDIRNGMPKFQSSRLNGVAKIKIKTHIQIHIYLYNYILLNVGNT